MRSILANKLKLSPRALIAFAHDVVMAALSVMVSLELRLGHDIFMRYFDHIEMVAVIFTPIAAVVFLVMGLYRGMWRYASMNDLLAITRATTVSLLLFMPVMFFVSRLEWLPRSFPVIHWFVLIFLLGAPRFLYRIVKDGNLSLVLDSGSLRVPVLLVGATDAAEAFIREMRRDPAAPFKVVGILDARPRRSGMNLHGLRILGALDAAQPAIDRLKRRRQAPQRFIIAQRDLPPEALRRLLAVAEANGMTIGRVPSLSVVETQPAEGSWPDGAAASTGPARLRPIAVEDLLGRPRQVLDAGPKRRLTAGRRILITGAGGSIGSELVRQIGGLGPAHVTLLEHSELALYEIDRRFRSRWPKLSVRPVLCDVRDRARVDEVIRMEQPDLVFHAAALKHVPLVEANACEGVLTNVIGTVRVAEACRAHGVAGMVLISTDKAVNPVSILGASKRLAEICCQALDAEPQRGAGEAPTRLVAVRFGNVLASTGSVVPLFQKQLAEGGPLTVTHHDVTRFFMTMREAVELVLQATAFGTSAALQPGDGGVFVLDMGQPVRILDLARQMIRLAGQRPGEDVKIVFTGLRPGEKLDEELFGARETVAQTEVPGVFLAKGPRPADWPLLRSGVDDLALAAAGGRAAQVIAILQRLVPEYVPAEAAVSSEPPAAAPVPPAAAALAAAR
jgi:O-antigen biosynthesis protein WbqV